MLIGDSIRMMTEERVREMKPRNTAASFSLFPYYIL